MTIVADKVVWWHSIRLPDGTVTPGRKPESLLRAEWDQLRLPALAGRSVLDIGANDGWFSFEAERRGARRVVAVDTWGDTLIGGYAESGRRGFDLAHASLGSGVEAVQADFMTMDLDALGTFDIVLFLGVLYHLRHPLLGLERLRAVTSGAAYIETELAAGDRPLCDFYEGDYRSDPSNWWVPTMTAVVAMCRAAGFASVVTLAGRPSGGRGVFKVLP